MKRMLSLVFLAMILRAGTLVAQPIYTFPICDSLNSGFYTVYMWWSDSLKIHKRDAFLVVNDFSKWEQIPDSIRFEGVLFSKNVYHYSWNDFIDSAHVCSCIDSKSWYYNGNVKSEILFVDSNGAYYRYYYENGNIQSEGYFRRNGFVPGWKSYDESGN